MGASAFPSALLRRDVRAWPRLAVGAPLWALYAASVAVLGVAYFAVGANSIPQAAIYQALSLGAIGAIVTGLIRYKPQRRIPWFLFGAGLVLWTLGDGYWDAYSWFLRTEAPFPSIADVAYVGGYPLLIAATFVVARARARPRLTDVLDSAVVATGALILVWALLVEPLLAQTGLSAAGMAVTVATPVLDVVLLVGVVQLALRKGVENPALRFLVVGVTCQVVTDVAYSYLTLKGAYTNGMFVDVGWIVAYGLFGVAALHPSMARIKPLPSSVATRFSSRRIALLAAATLCAPVVMIADSLSGDPIGVVGLSIGSIVVTFLVGARLVLLQQERNRMLAAVDVGREKYRELFEQADESRAALAVQNERLRELDHLKDNLISVVSHELRTPLTSILGYLELLDQDRDRLTQRHRHFLGVVGRNAERLLDIVVDLLFVAQARAGHMTLDREPLDLSELAEHAVEGTLPAANERQITITVAPCSDSVVSGDRQRLGQVLDNLLSNALKFTPRNGSVEVRLSASRDYVVLEVADTGIGISAGAQRELFTRFFRTDAAIEAAIQGTGLGLSIVKAIVDGHGGQVSVESIEGEGATFTVNLPRLAAARAA
ncbi:MAG: HAMP domain-containing histidine kinase [Actinobacteria bacterium]|nr:MAG: HAMP domain-containing histidine kinase [Actinomycetota bacterium]